MNASPSGGSGDVATLHGLSEGLRAVRTEAEPREVAAQIVSLIASHPKIVGARLSSGGADQAPQILAEKGIVTSATAGERISSLVSAPSGEALDSNYAAWTLGAAEKRRGLLEVSSRDSFDDATLEWLGVIRTFAEVALAGSERRSAVAELSIVLEATQRLNSTLDLAKLIDIILHLATGYTGADRGTVFLFDRERDEIWSLVGLGLEQHEIRLSASRGIAGWVAKNGETVNLVDAYQDSRFEPDVDRQLNYRTRSLLCLPIRTKDGQTAGVLQLLNKKGGSFQPADESLLNYRKPQSIAPPGGGVVVVSSVDELQAKIADLNKPQPRWSGPIAIVMFLLCLEAFMGSARGAGNPKSETRNPNT